ncbi:hypothetical protein DFP72DRAFT_1082116 [Ephemerocybe angulata]|uniref:Uncharacterized protein n=1 Tax=Ephemerocybe angulata TaxID=980116 RepID=A0A8H6H9W5_9AGAR|nr:hypothetical protein DFP72DRAFT_1082116 [Tulosesus angulatus]
MSRFSVSNHESPVFPPPSSGYVVSLTISFFSVLTSLSPPQLARRKTIYRDFVVRARADVNTVEPNWYVPSLTLSFTPALTVLQPLAGNRYIVTLPCHNSGRHTRPHPQSLDKRPALIHQQQQQQQKRPQQQQQQQQT